MIEKQYPQIPVSSSDEQMLIPLLNAESDFLTFSEGDLSFQASELPFFKNYLLLTAWYCHSIPPISFLYLWNKNDAVIVLNGTKEPVFENLQKLELVLNAKTIIPYIRFVLNNVWTSGGSMRLVEDYEEIKFSSKPTEEEIVFLLKNIRPAKVTPTENGYNIDAVVILDDCVFQSNIMLQSNGIFDIESETLLCEKYRCLRPVFLE